MNSEADPIQSRSDDDLSISDIWQMLAEGWFWIVGGMVGGVIGAVGYLAVTPPQYEAMALVQIGQVGQIGQIGQIGQGGQGTAAPVEAPARVVERIMFPTFKGAIVKKLGWTGSQKGPMFESSLKAAVAKGTDLIELRVRGLTREDAEKSLEATGEHLAALHKEAAQLGVESLQAELAEISAEAKEARKLLGELERAARLQLQGSPRDRFIESVLYAQLSTSYENRNRELRRRETQYRELISFLGKATTKTFAGPSVSEVPVSPKKPQTFVVASLGGGLVGVLAAVLRRGRRVLHPVKELFAND